MLTVLLYKQARILNDIEESPENIALLEFALTELWQKQTDNKLTHQAYEDIGQVKGALADYAEEVYDKLGNKEKEQARQIFTQLVRLGEEGHKDTRRVVNRNQIGEENWQLVIRKYGLANSRLVVTNLDRNQRETLEVVHEALFLHWQRLRRWLEEDRDNLKIQHRIEDDAKQWQDSGEKNDYLLKNKRLRTAKKFQQEQQDKYPLSELAVSFIARSIQNQRRENIKSLGLFLIIPFIGTIFIGSRVYEQIRINEYWQILSTAQGQEYNPAIIEALEFLHKEADQDFNNINFMGANLEKITLFQPKFRGANLSGANLREAYLKGSDFNEANLSNANLTQARLENSDFGGANLKGANFSEANLRKVNFHDSNYFWINHRIKLSFLWKYS